MMWRGHSGVIVRIIFSLGLIAQALATQNLTSVVTYQPGNPSAGSTSAPGLMGTVGLVKATVCVGSYLVLSCGFNSIFLGNDSNHQWYKNDVRIKGMEEAVLVFERVELGHAGSYSCVTVTGRSRYVTSGTIKVIETDTEHKYWFSLACGSFGVAFLAILLCAYLYIRVRRYKKARESYLINGPPRANINGSRVPGLATPFSQMQLQLPGIKLPHANSPLIKGEPLVGKNSSSSQMLLPNGYVLPKTQSPLQRAPEYSTGWSHDFHHGGQPQDDNDVTPPPSCDQNTVYESYKDQGHGLRPRCASEPPTMQGSARYASLGSRRNDSVYYSSLEGTTKSSETSQNTDTASNNNDNNDTLAKRRMDKPLPAPRPKKGLPVDSPEYIIEEVGFENEDNEDENETEDGDGYVRPKSPGCVDGQYLTAKSLEPRYMNAVPYAPSRREDNLYDAVHRPSIDEDQESYYLKLRNSVHHKKLTEASSSTC